MAINASKRKSIQKYYNSNNFHLFIIFHIYYIYERWTTIYYCAVQLLIFLHFHVHHVSISKLHINYIINVLWYFFYNCIGQQLTTTKKKIFVVFMQPLKLNSFFPLILQYFLVWFWRQIGYFCLGHKWYKFRCWCWNVMTSK